MQLDSTSILDPNDLSWRGRELRAGVADSVDPLDQPSAWDALLATHSEATFFHASAWARTLRDTYGFRPIYFTIRSQRGLQALLPIMEVNSLFTGRRGVSLPFTDECPALTTELITVERLFWQAVEYGKSRRWKYLECRGGCSPFDGATPSISFYSHNLDLSGGREALFARFDNCVRRAIRKAEGSNLNIEISRSLDGIRSYYALHCKTRKKHGLPPQPFAFFASIQRSILAKDLGFVVLAHDGTNLVAGSVYFLHGQDALYKFGASDEAFQHLRGNNLVMWSAIKHLICNRFKFLDFGRTSLSNEGLRRFKQGWGTKERIINYYRYNLRQGAFVTAGDNAFGWHNRVFNRMPVRFAQLAGALLYKHTA